LVKPDMTLSQYLKGSTADFDAGVIDTMSAGGGEGGLKAMAIGYSGVAPACTEYANLTTAQKEVVDAWCVAFIDSVEAAIAAGEPLETNPAYTTLHNLQGMAWFGRWGSWGRGVVDAFYMTWPNPAGRGSECEFRDWITANGLAGVTGNDAYVWEGAGTGTKYALQSAADRATIDADLALFEETMQDEVDAAYAAAAAAGAAAGEAAFTAELETNWPEAYQAAMDAFMAVVATDPAANTAAEAAFSAELTNWSDALVAAMGAYNAWLAAHPGDEAGARAAFQAAIVPFPVAFAACIGAFMAALADYPATEQAANDAFQGTLYLYYPEALDAAVAAATAAGIAAGTPAMMGVVMASEAFAVLKVLGLPAAEGWKADVSRAVNPVHPRQAFYIWMAKGAVSAMAAAAPLIRLSVAEFSIKVTNPNEYWISLDTLTINASIDVNWFGTVIPVDMSKVVLNEKVWVPPMEGNVKGEITVRLLAPVKVYDVITWGVMAGYDSTKAGGLATFAFDKIQNGTAVWDMTIDAVISSETETITESYDLQWTPG
jgi:hypothetical protein